MFKLISGDEAPKPRRKWSGIIQDIEAFVETGGDACEVMIPEDCQVQTVYNTYFQTAKRNHMPVTVMRRKGRVFIVKK